MLTGAGQGWIKHSRSVKTQTKVLTDTINIHVCVVKYLMRLCVMITVKINGLSVCAIFLLQLLLIFSMFHGRFMHGNL